MLSEAIYEPNYTIQMYAAAALSKVTDKSTCPIFLDLIKSKKKQHKLVAINALSNLKCNKALPEIISIIENEDLPIKVRSAAFSALQNIDKQKAIEFSLKCLGVSSKGFKKEAIIFLASQNNPEGLEEYKDLVTRKTTIKQYLPFLAQIVEPLQEKSVDLLNDLYQKDDVITKITVIAACNKMKDLTSVSNIIEEALNSDNLQLKYTAFNILINNKSEHSLKWIETVKFNKPEEYIPATKLLIKAETENIDTILKQYLELKDEKLNFLIASYFISKKINSDLAKNILIDILNSEDIMYKNGAALTLTDSGFNNETALELTRKLLESDNSTLKAKAAIALAKANDKSIIPYLSKAIKDNNSSGGAYGAALLLYNLGDETYLDILIRYLSRNDIDAVNEAFINKDLFKELTNHSNNWVKLNSANSLINSGDMSVYDTVTLLLENEDAKIRSGALKIIGKYGSIDDIQSVQKLLDDDYVRVRVNAAEAILRIIHREENNHRS